MTDLAAYGGLFLAAFLAATILPLQSETVLAALLMSERYPVAALLAIASIGNTLGAVANWALGRGIARFRQARWFPVSEAALARAEAWYRRFGRWSLLLSWAPFIGDPLTVAAGVLRERLVVFVALVGLAKTARYLVIVAIALSWM